MARNNLGYTGWKTRFQQLITQEELEKPWYITVQMSHM
jgi:hypothetical protein